jgi:hypothetical protein
MFPGPRLRTICALTVFATAGAARAATVTIAHLDDPSIAPRQFTGFGSVVLNDAGQAAFVARFDFPVADEDTGVFRGEGGPLTLIAREGYPLPGDPLGSYGYDEFLDPATRPQLAVNDSGHVAFWTRVKGPTVPPALHNEAVLLYDGKETVLAARTPGAPPDGNGQYYTFFRFVGLSEPGDVIFRALLFDADLAVSGNSGVFFHSTRDPMRTQDVFRYSRLGDPVCLVDSCSANGTFSLFFGNAVTNFNDAGEIAHMGVLTEPDGRQIVYFASGAGEATPPRRVFRGGEFGNWDFSGHQIGSLHLDPAVNDHGDVLFVGGVIGGSFSTSPSAVLRSRTSSFPQLIALTDHASPDGNGVLTGFSQPRINNRLQMAFATGFWQSDGDTFDDSGIIMSTGGVRTILVREADPIPSGGRFADMSFQPSFALNHGGQVAFQTDIIDDTNGKGIFLSDSTEMIEVVRTGDMLEGRAIADVEFVGGASRQRTGLNLLGQVAYRAVLDNGAEAVALTTPEIHWRRDPNGGGPNVWDWDYAPNWTVGIQPREVHDVYLDFPQAFAQVYGPRDDVTVKSLTIGSAKGSVSLFLTAGVTLRSRNAIDFAASNALFVDLAGGDAPQCGRLVAGGDIHLSGSFSFRPVAGSEPLPGQSFEVITSVDGVITGQLFAYADYDVDYTARSVTVTVLPRAGDISAVSSFAGCMNGPDASPGPPSGLTPDGCLIAFDSDDDGDIDLADHAALELLLTRD